MLQNIWKDIRNGHNLDVYVTIAIAVTVAILGIFGVTQLVVVSSAILAVLALVSGAS